MKESSSVCHHYHQSANSQQQLRHTHQRRSPMRSTMNRIDHNSAKKWLNISQKFRLASQLMLLTCLMLMLANQLAEAETSSSLHSSSSQSIPVPTTNSNISKRDLSDSIKLATSNGKQLTDGKFSTLTARVAHLLLVSCPKQSSRMSRTELGIDMQIELGVKVVSLRVMSW